MQLMAFYDEEPIKAKNASVVQMPLVQADDYTFGNEPTAVRTIYVRHPRIERRLVPYGQYDSLLMTDKFNEALRIVQMLGAHTVITKAYRGDLSRFALKAKGVGLDAEKANREEIAFDQLGSGGPPRDPGPTSYPDAAGFEAARHAVLLNGAQRVQITIESESAFRVDSDIAGVLKKVGFSLGAAGEKAQVRMLKIEAYFPARGKLHTPDPASLVAPAAAKVGLDPDAQEKNLFKKLLGN